MSKGASVHRPFLILASASPRRNELLRQLHLDFDVIPSDASETHFDHLTPAETAKQNAWLKAASVAKNHPKQLVLGADTLVCLNNEVFGKPKNLNDARRMLQQLQGKTHWVVTGVCLLRLRPHYNATFADTTQVTFRQLSDDEINRYLELMNPLDKAGAYAIQEHGGRLVASLDGSFSNVVGLPLEKLGHELKRFGARES